MDEMDGSAVHRFATKGVELRGKRARHIIFEEAGRMSPGASKLIDELIAYTPKHYMKGVTNKEIQEALYDINPSDRSFMMVQKTKENLLIEKYRKSE